MMNRVRWYSNASLSFRDEDFMIGAVYAYCGCRQNCCWRGTSVLLISDGNLGTALTTILPATTVQVRVRANRH